jgi:hypothetical protein
MCSAVKARKVRARDINAPRKYSQGGGWTQFYTNKVKVNMDEELQNRHFEILWDMRDFQEYARLSVFTRHEQSFHNLAKLAQDDRATKRFDKACQIIFSAIEDSTTNFRGATNDVGRSFMLQLYKLQIDDNRLRAAMNEVPDVLQNHTDHTPNLLCRLLVKFMGNMYQFLFLTTLDWIIAEENTSTTAMGPEKSLQRCNVSKLEATKEAHYFFGWAVACVLAKYEEKLINGQCTQAECSYLSNIGTNHDAIINNQHYVQLYYPALVQLHNHRQNLTLVSQQYMQFGIHLLEKIRQHLNQESIAEQGTECIEIPFMEVNGDDELEAEFFNCQNSQHDNVEDTFCAEVYDILIRKTFHSRAGAETKIFKERNTSRYVQGTLDTAFREGLKTSSKRKSNHVS